MRAWSLKRIAALHNPAAAVAGFSADAHHLLGAPVVGFEILVGNAPVLYSKIVRQTCGAVFFAEMRAKREQIRQEAPGHALPMLARAADSGASEKRARS